MSKKNTILFLIMIVLFSAVLSASADFQDDFSDPDYTANGWNMSLMFGRADLDYLFPDEGKLSVHMPNYNTALYMLNENTDTEDSTVEVTIENIFSANSEVGLICRYHDYGWYELRVTLSGQYAGSYKLYKYDNALRAEKKNPFVSLHPDQERFFTKQIHIGPNAQNTFKMICEDKNIRIFINGNEQAHPWNLEFKADDYSNGTSGFSVWTETPRGQAQIDLLNFRSLFEEQ